VNRTGVKNEHLFSCGAKERLLSEAVRIGDWILARTEVDGDGTHWRTMAVDESKDVTTPESIHWVARENLYTGVSGISLFLMELHRHTRIDRYLSAADDGLRWVERRFERGELQRCALYEGRLGTAYALLRLAEITGEDEHVDRAVRIAASCSGHRMDAAPSNDLLRGASGALLGFLHVFSVSPEPWLLDEARKTAERLVDRAQSSSRGLHWDHSIDQIRGLCGLAHGASGPALAFLEAGAFLGKEPMHALAGQAFAYEDDCFDHEKTNWPDFRQGRLDLIVQRCSQEGALRAPESLRVPGDTNTWCHGAVGIGLCRLRALLLLGRGEFESQVRRAVERTLDPRPTDGFTLETYTLCHGRAGALELVSESARILGDDHMRRAAERMTADLLAARASRLRHSGYRFAGSEPDPSLFLGEAGIGYTLLRLSDPALTPSILVPELRSHREPSARPSLSMKALRTTLVTRIYPRTLQVLERWAPSEIAAHFDVPPREGSEGPAFEALIDRLDPRSFERHEMLMDVYALERHKHRMNLAVDSFAALHVQEQLDRRRAEEMRERGGAQLLQRSLKLAERAHLQVHLWSWEEVRLTDETTEPGCFPVLLSTYARLKTIEHWLPIFTYEVLSGFCAPRTIAEAADSLRGFADGDVPLAPAVLRSKVLDLVLGALLDGVLVEERA
jgi:hypothetical protein